MKTPIVLTKSTFVTFTGFVHVDKAAMFFIQIRTFEAQVPAIVSFIYPPS